MEYKEIVSDRLGKILIEIESMLWDSHGVPLHLSDEAFRAVLKIFMDSMMGRLWQLQQNEDMDMDIREDMAGKLGIEIRQLIKTYTGVDTFELYSPCKP